MYKKNWDSEVLDDKFKVIADPHTGGIQHWAEIFHTEISQLETHKEPQEHIP